MTTRRDALRRRRTTAAVAALAVLVVLTGCSSGSGSSADRGGVSSVAELAAPGVDDSALSPSVGAAAEDRSVIVNGSIDLTADEPIEVAGLVAAAVESAGGYLDARSESEGNGSSSAWARMTVRLPPGEVQTMIDSLRLVGEVTSVDLTSSDVTDQVADLGTRISAKKTAITRLEELMAGAGSMTDLLAVERELTSRQSELEQLLAQQAGLADLTSMATLEISVYATDEEPPSDEPSGFLGGLSAGWDSLVGALAVAVTALGAMLPWLVVIGAVGWVVLVVVRRRRGSPAATTTAPQPPVGAARTAPQPPGAVSASDLPVSGAAPAAPPETAGRSPEHG